jgi:hypothetical protein
MNLSLKDIYKEYKKEYKTIKKDKSFIINREFLRIIYLFLKFLIKKVIEGEEVVLLKLGTLKVLGRKQEISYDENNNIKGISPNWVKTKKLWENNEQARKEKRKVYNTNEHSDGIRYKYNWGKKKLILKFKILYALQFSRENKRMLSKKIKEGKDYLTK